MDRSLKFAAVLGFVAILLAFAAPAAFAQGDPAMPMAAAASPTMTPTTMMSPMMASPSTMPMTSEPMMASPTMTASPADMMGGNQSIMGKAPTKMPNATMRP